MFLLFINIASAAVVFDHECSDQNCIQDTEISFLVTIQNNIGKALVVDTVNIRDVNSKKVIGLYVGAPVSLSPGESHFFNISSLVPEPFEGFTVYYTTCFEATVMQDEDNSTADICSDIVKSFTTIPLSNIECRTNDECAPEEYCNTFSLYECRPLECSGGQIVIDHECASCKYPALSGLGFCISPIIPVGFLILLVLLIYFGVKKKKPQRKPAEKTMKKPKKQ